MKRNQNWWCSFEDLKIKIYSYLVFHCSSINYRRNTMKISFYSGPNRFSFQRNHQTPNVPQTRVSPAGEEVGLDGYIARDALLHLLLWRHGPRATCELRREARGPEPPLLPGSVQGRPSSRGQSRGALRPPQPVRSHPSRSKTLPTGAGRKASGCVGGRGVE